MRHKITAPVEGFSGSVVGVSFDDGHAETEDNNAVQYFRRHGYTVEAVRPAKKTAAAKPQD